MRNILITGGPKAGKTTVVTALEHQLKVPAIFVEEAATKVLRDGFRVRPDGEAARELWHREFQDEVYGVQMKLEADAVARAQELGIQWVIYDRSEFDGMGYHPDGIEGYGRIYDLTLQQMHQKYEAVIFLETLAIAFPHLFDSDNNEHRYEDSAEEAIYVNSNLFEVYKNHPNLYLIPSGLGEREKIRACNKFIVDLQK